MGHISKSSLLYTLHCRCVLFQTGLKKRDREREVTQCILAACRAVSNPQYDAEFPETYHVSPLSLFRCCDLGQGTLPSHVSFEMTICTIKEMMKDCTLTNETAHE